MRALLTLFLLLSVVILSMLQFSSIAQLNDPRLISQLQTQLLEKHVEQSADNFNRSLSTETLGKILHRAADLITTRVTLLNTQKSHNLINPDTEKLTIVHARYLIENTSEEPLEETGYLAFSQDAENNWIYRGQSNAQDFYLNFAGFRSTD